MPGSEEAFGAGHPSTKGRSTKSTFRRIEISEGATERSSDPENLKAYADYVAAQETQNRGRNPEEMSNIADYSVPFGIVAVESAIGGSHDNDRPADTDA